MLHQTLPSISVRRHDRRPAGFSVDPIDPRRQFEIGLVALVIAEDAVARIGEPDGAVRGYDHVVGGVELLALVAVQQHIDGAVRLGPGDAPRIVLAADEPPLAIARVAVGIVRGRAEDAHMPVFLQPAHHAIVGNIAPHQKSAVAEIDRALGPAEAGGDPLDRRIADHVFELLVVEHFDARVGVAPIGQIPQGQCVRLGGIERHRGRGSGGTSQKSASFHDNLLPRPRKPDGSSLPKACQTARRTARCPTTAECGD